MRPWMNGLVEDQVADAGPGQISSERRARRPAADDNHLGVESGWVR